MLQQSHPDFGEYAKDPTLFKQVLFRRLRDAYSSLYNDQTDDIIKALDALDKGLHEGYTADIMVTKIKQAANLTENDRRSGAAKFISNHFWKRSFVKPQTMNPVKPTQPYTGPTPKRP